MKITDKKEIQDAYKKEAKSLIKKIGQELGVLRSTNDAPRLFRLFRYVHTLKGISGAMKFYEIENIAGGIAEIFRAAKNGDGGIKSENKILIREKLDQCERLLKESILTRCIADGEKN